MRLTFLGGADEIGASCALLELDGRKLLVDCGQRMNAAPGQNLPDFSKLEGGAPLDAILLTHAHADHIGALPALEAWLPSNCPIYGTEPTLALVKTMLKDSVKVMYQHRRGDGDLAFFTPASVSAVLDRLSPVPWLKPKGVVPKSAIRATWYPAGHILGAGMIDIQAGNQSILFSGDISVTEQISVPGVFVPALSPQVLVLESTYGSRLHAHRPAQEQRIVERVAESLARGGHVLFPTFALGRAQEILLVLGRAMREGSMPKVPVYADGLVRTLSKVYLRFPDELAPFCRQLWEEGLDPMFPSDLPIRAVRDDKQRTQIAGGPPSVVVASSGMLQGGASQFYARHWISDRRSLIVLTGYQDEESPGQALLELASLPPDQPRYFKMGGVRASVACEIENLQLSAHADNEELVTVAGKLAPRQIFLVHGDADARMTLAKSLMARSRAEVTLPQLGESFTFGDDELGRNRYAPGARPDPLTAWPDWDPEIEQKMDLARFHHWLAKQDPKIGWVTLDELAELWRSPKRASAEDRDALRQEIYATTQPFFLPDPRRPYLLRVAELENVTRHKTSSRLPVEVAAPRVREFFPPHSALIKYGFFPEEGVLELSFAFPTAAKENLARRLADLAERIGWKIRLNAKTDPVELARVARQSLDLPDRHAVEIQDAQRVASTTVAANTVPADLADLIEEFARRTGYQLNVLTE